MKGRMSSTRGREAEGMRETRAATPRSAGVPVEVVLKEAREGGGAGKEEEEEEEEEEV